MSVEWGGGHDQQMGIVALARRMAALFDAKTMLFIDHHQLQLVKGYRRFEIAWVLITSLILAGSQPGVYIFFLGIGVSQAAILFLPAAKRRRGFSSLLASRRQHAAIMVVRPGCWWAP